MAAGKNANITLGAGWKVIPATVVFALLLAGIEQIPDLGVTFAKGIATIALITVVLTAPNPNTKAPAQNLAKILGYGK
jgi:hypothetical protein